MVMLLLKWTLAWHSVTTVWYHQRHFASSSILTFVLYIMHPVCVGEGPHAHLQKLAECIRWSYGAGIILRLGNIARLELNYCFPMGVQSGDRYIFTSTEPHSCWITGNIKAIFFCSQTTNFLPLLWCFKLNSDGFDKNCQIELSF